MGSKLLALTGDINLMHVPEHARPFAQVESVLKRADLVFSNLECCFFEPREERSIEAEGFFAPPGSAQLLVDAGVQVVGNANNVNYGAAAIRASLGRLEEVGLAFTGAGRDRAEALRPIVVDRGGVRFGFLQRTCVYWRRGHQASADSPGVAVVEAHTAYRPLIENSRALTRPGMPPEIVTWADPKALESLAEDIANLRRQVDVLVLSMHWGLDDQVLDYQRQIAHTAIAAGADVVFGHGPHVLLPFERFRGKFIIYGAGSFSFNIGHSGRKHPDWLGLLAQARVGQAGIEGLSFRFVRHNADNETIFRRPEDEPDAMAWLSSHCEELGVALARDGDWVELLGNGSLA